MIETQEIPSCLVPHILYITGYLPLDKEHAGILWMSNMELDDVKLNVLKAMSREWEPNVLWVKGLIVAGK